MVPDKQTKDLTHDCVPPKNRYLPPLKFLNPYAPANRAYGRTWYSAECGRTRWRMVRQFHLHHSGDETAADAETHVSDVWIHRSQIVLTRNSSDVMREEAEGALIEYVHVAKTAFL